MYGVLNEVCEIISRMGVTFRDECNEPSSIMIGYSDTTLITHNHPLIVRSMTSLTTVTATVQ